MTTVLDSLNAGLHAAFAANERVLLLGEDVLDPYGGAFKVTRGLSTQFPNRVIPTPISEAGITGVGIGLALGGYRPVVEIMFGDFLTLAIDQLINAAGKFGWMYNPPVQVPLVLRTPMGGRRGYGPTHSQTLEKHLLGAPGLTILAPFQLSDSPGKLLENTILHTSSPVIFIENKLQYLLPLLDEKTLADTLIETSGKSVAPTYCLRMRGAPQPQLTLTAYGYMAELCRQALLRLAYEDEIFVELIVPTQLAPFDLGAVLDSARRSRRLLTVEEGGLSLGWGAEVLAQAAESIPCLLAAGRVAARDLPVPASQALEAQVLPDVAQIIQAVKKMV
jgi:acetoin:2,6-dichlorophenolindophenol oxidoreductase subunit beta